MNVKKTKPNYVVLATDVALLTIRDGALKLLVVKSSPKSPFLGKYILPGGVVGVDEIGRVSAARHLERKTGISEDKVPYMEQLFTFSRIDRDPRNRAVSMAYLAVTSEEILQFIKFPDTVKFVSATRPPKLGYDHNRMVNIAVAKLRERIEHTTIAHALLPRAFTLSELQKVYEIVLQKKLDKRNFRKQITSLGFVKATGKKQTKAANRPAELYKYTKGITQDIHFDLFK